MATEIQHFINGRLVPGKSGKFAPVFNPATGEQNGSVPLAGKQDQAGGLVWRWKDGDNYYVARANALENNVSLYYTERGRRIEIADPDLRPLQIGDERERALALVAELITRQSDFLPQRFRSSVSK